VVSQFERALEKSQSVQGWPERFGTLPLIQ